MPIKPVDHSQTSWKRCQVSHFSLPTHLSYCKLTQFLSNSPKLSLIKTMINSLLLNSIDNTHFHNPSLHSANICWLSTVC
jgi:hypothetical protein